MEPTPFDRGIRRPDSSPRRQQRQGQLWDPFPPLFVPRRAAGLSPSLLPHPGGLEGLLPRLVEGDAGDTPVAERPHPGTASLDLDTVAAPEEVRDRRHYEI